MILDASVWAAAVDPSDRGHEESKALYRAAIDAVRATDLTVYEVANVAVVRWGDRDKAERLVHWVLESCGDRLMRIGHELAADTARLAFEHGLTGYDASYLAAAEAVNEVLVSLDIQDLVSPGHAITPGDALARLHKDQPPH